MKTQTLGVCCTTPRTKSIDVSTAPTSTTNITGFFISVRGFSFTNDSHTAVHHNFLSPAGLFSSACFSGHRHLKHLSCVHQQMFQNRSQAQRREKCQRADDQHYRNQQRR